MDSPRSIASSESRPRGVSIANLSREDLEKTVQTLLKRLKQRDREQKEREAKGKTLTEGPSPDAATHATELAAWAEEKKSLEASLTAAIQQRDILEQDLQAAVEETRKSRQLLQESQAALKAKESEKGRLTRQLQELQDEDQALQQQVMTLKEAVAATVEERDGCFERLAEGKESLLDMEAALSAAQTNMREMQKELASLAKERDELKAVNRELTESQAGMEDKEQERIEQKQRDDEERQTLREKLEAANQQAAELLELNAAREKQNQELVDRLVTLETVEDERNAAVERLEEMEREVGLLKGITEKGETVPAELAKELEERVEKYREKCSVLESTLSATEKTLAEAYAEAESTQQNLADEISALKASEANLKDTLESLRAKLSSLESTAKNAVDERASCEAAIQTLQSEIASEKQKAEEWKEKNSKLEDQMEDLKHICHEHSELTAKVAELQHSRQGAANDYVSLKETLLLTEKRLEDARSELASQAESHGAQLKELRAELESVQKGRSAAEDHVKAMETEVSQLKAALTKSTSKLDEETQSHRIARQRLNDEQETGQHLRQQLQEALSKMQSTEVEAWKQQELTTSQQQEAEEKHLKIQEELQKELARLKETVTVQVAQMQTHEEELEKVKETAEAEKEKLKRAVVEVKKRLDRTSAQLKKTELEGTELQDSHFAEKEKLTTEISHRQHQLEKLNTELKDYKAKAHLLVKNKDQELNALKAELQHRTDVEVDLKVLSEKFDDLTVERDNIKEELMQANERFQVHLDDLVAEFQGQIDEKTAAVAEAQSEKQTVATALHEWKEMVTGLKVELKEKEDALAAASEAARSVPEGALESALGRYQALEEELEDLRAEFQSYRQTSEQMSEVQQREMSRLIQANLELRRVLVEEAESVRSDKTPALSRHSVSREMTARMDNFQLSDLLEGRQTEKPFRLEDGESLSESQIVALASKQAEREDKFHELKRENDQLRREVEDMEKELELHKEQEAVLKSYLREADQLKRTLSSAPAHDLDFPYLRNMVMKLITTGESEALLPVFAKLLNFTEEETAGLATSIQEARKKAVSQEAAPSVGLFSSLTDWTWT